MTISPSFREGTRIRVPKGMCIRIWLLQVTTRVEDHGRNGPYHQTHI